MRGKEKFLITLVLVVCGLGACRLDEDISGFPCTESPDFECAPGYSCRWVSGDPVCLKIGAENPDPLLFYDDFEDPEWSLEHFRLRGDWHISDGKLKVKREDKFASVASLQNLPWLDGTSELFWEIKVLLNNYAFHASIAVAFKDHGGAPEYSCGWTWDFDESDQILFYIYQETKGYVCQINRSKEELLPQIDTEYTFQGGVNSQGVVTCRLPEFRIEINFTVSSPVPYSNHHSGIGIYTDPIEEPFKAQLDDIKFWSERPSHWSELITSECEN